MSARYVLKIATEQTLLRAVLPGRCGVDDGSFAQSLHLDLQKAPEGLSRLSAGDGSLPPSGSSLAQSSDKNRASSCSALAMMRTSGLIRVETQQSDLTVGSLGVERDHNVGAGAPQFETVAGSLMQSTQAPSQERVRTEIRQAAIPSFEDPVIPPPISTKKSKRETGSAKEKPKTQFFATDATKSVETNAGLSPPIQASLQFPIAMSGGTKTGSNEIPRAVRSAELPGYSQGSQGVPSPRIPLKIASQGSAADVEGWAVPQTAGQVAAGQVELATAAKLIASIPIESSSNDVKAPVFVVLSMLDTNRAIDTSAIALVTFPHPAGAETNQSIHAGDSSVHAGILSPGLEERGTISAGSESIDGSPRTLVATGTTLEIGVQSETHGWLRVRAELTEGGTVNASLATTSSSSQSALHRELPGLTAYLQSEKVSVNTIVIHPSTFFGTESRGSNGSAADGDGGQKQQHDGRRQKRQEGAGSISFEPLSGEAVEENWNEGGREGLLATAMSTQGSNWLSVRA